MSSLKTSPHKQLSRKMVRIDPVEGKKNEEKDTVVTSSSPRRRAWNISVLPVKMPHEPQRIKAHLHALPLHTQTLPRLLPPLIAIKIKAHV